MTAPLSLVVFDVDGTLVDSQAHILHAMDAAFQAVERPVPPRETALSVVGLSLPLALQRLAPDADTEVMVAAYKSAFAAARIGRDVASPLYPGARAALDALANHETVLLGIATGKSRRGLDHVLEAHDLISRFHTEQVSDHHPSKPHPAMLEAALSETGVGAERAVMVGDTTYDIEMARAAGFTAIGVGWGYHATDQLVAAGASHVIDDFADLTNTLDAIWSENA